MPSISRTCKITGRKFQVSELEQKLRAGFGVPLPDVHPYERLRSVMCFRNLITLYNDKCDLCGKAIISLWGENPAFPVYCPTCWNSDKWQPPQMDLDLERSFFDQYKELVNRSPHCSIVLKNPVNSDYCNNVTSVKDSYFSFNVIGGEDCYFVYGGLEVKKCLDTTLAERSEILYESINCWDSFQVFWSELVIKCTDSYFLYDCSDCQNCAMSTGLRHKSYVFQNEQYLFQCGRAHGFWFVGHKS